jgi:uncharacterized protein YceK
MNHDDYDKEFHDLEVAYKACLYCIIGITALLLLLMLTGCSTVKSEESTTDQRFVTELNAKMDSLIHRTSTWQETFLSKQSSIIDSIKHSEVRDTSHTIFLGAKGDTIKETVIIRQYIEREHTTDTKETEQWIERFRQTDSLLQVSLDRQEKTDSLLHEYQKTTVVEKQLSLWERIKMNFGGFALIVLVIFIFVVCFRTQGWLRRKSTS